jgi:hypothetical protein
MPGSSGRARKLAGAIAHAVDHAFFELLAQSLEARAHGRKTLLTPELRDELPTHTVRELGDSKIMECAAVAVRAVETGAPLTR